MMLKIICYFISFTGGTVLLYMYACLYCADEGNGKPSKVRFVTEDTLLISGGIDQTLMNQVQAALATHEGSIRRIRLNSTGGQTDMATKLIKKLKPFHPIVEIPADATCQSACIDLLAEISDRREIHPSSTLMFHSDATRFGLANNGFCGCVNWITINGEHLLDPGKQNQMTMLSWARELNPRLQELFEACPTNPLHTQTGLYLTGQEFNLLSDGAIEPKNLLHRCPLS